MIEIKAPLRQNISPWQIKIFLGGSIEMGKAKPWQKELTEKLKHLSNLVVYNPRRDDWDSSWEQTIENEKFVEQVKWELEHLEKSDLIIIYLQAETISPISLYELGHFGTRKRVIVLCEEGYFRKGNVDIICEVYGISQVKTLDEFAVIVEELCNQSPGII